MAKIGLVLGCQHYHWHTWRLPSTLSPCILVIVSLDTFAQHYHHVVWLLLLLPSLDIIGEWCCFCLHLMHWYFCLHLMRFVRLTLLLLPPPQILMKDAWFVDLFLWHHKKWIRKRWGQTSVQFTPCSFKKNLWGKIDWWVSRGVSLGARWVELQSS